MAEGRHEVRWRRPNDPVGHFGESRVFAGELHPNAICDDCGAVYHCPPRRGQLRLLNHCPACACDTCVVASATAS